MRMFATYLIAILLFGLCLWENELRKGAVRAEINTKNYTELSPVPSRNLSRENFLIKSKFNYQSRLTPDNGQYQIPSVQFISADSSDITNMPVTPTITVQ